MTHRSPLPEFIPFRDPKNPRLAAGPRVLVLADEREPGVRSRLRSTTPALAAAGYRLSFVAASQDSLISTVGEKLRARNYALVHVHGPWLAPVVRLAGVLSSTPPMLVSLSEPPRTTGVRRWLLGRALALADGIVCACEDDRAALLRTFPNLRGRQERTMTLVEGIDVAAVPMRVPGGSELRIACVPADGEIVREATSRLLRFGHVPAFRATDALDACDVCVVASRGGMPSAMHALCAGVPLVALDVPGLREVCEGTPARVCPPDAASLESALRETLSDPREDEARRYASRARERYDERRANGALVALYDRVTASVGARAA